MQRIPCPAAPATFKPLAALKVAGVQALQMSIANHCRIKAAESREKAQNERVPMIKAEWENLAKVYLRLAQHVDRNAAADFVNEQADITQQHTQSVPGRRRNPP